MNCKNCQHVKCKIHTVSNINVLIFVFKLYRLWNDDSERSEELPVVVVLAHKENMTKNSAYSQVLLFIFAYLRQNRANTWILLNLHVLQEAYCKFSILIWALQLLFVENTKNAEVCKKSEHCANKKLLCLQTLCNGANGREAVQCNTTANLKLCLSADINGLYQSYRYSVD